MTFTLTQWPTPGRFQAPTWADALQTLAETVLRHDAELAAMRPVEPTPIYDAMLVEGWTR